MEDPSPGAGPAPAMGSPASAAGACAGWRAGSEIMQIIARTGRPPTIVGPVADDLADRAGQAYAWQTMQPLPALSMRRVDDSI